MATVTRTQFGFGTALVSATLLFGFLHAQITRAADESGRMTAFPGGMKAQRSHVKRLLALTGFRAVQWMNFNRSIVQLQTVHAQEN